MTPDPVNHPTHYQHPSGIECIDITEHMSFCLGNAIKYIWRCDSKGQPIQDLRKAVAYLEREITRRINKENGCPLVAKSVLPYAIDKTDPIGKVGTVLAYAQAGDAYRQNQMGKIYYYGKLMPQDYEAAVEWWQKAADQGNYAAQVSLSHAYRYGEGVAKDEKLANYWLEKSFHATS
jgi:TPR repeat protein